MIGKTPKQLKPKYRPKGKKMQITIIRPKTNIKIMKKKKETNKNAK